MIIHTVQFKLKQGLAPNEIKDFFDEAKLLASIRGTKNFKAYLQVSAKNPFTHSFSMEFEDQRTYDFYSSHTIHADFVEKQWIPKVELFQEADFRPFEFDPCLANPTETNSEQVGGHQPANHPESE
ncbi:MAG: Dabb family protein [Planctomycetota bacterium]|nr:Dabb family protein [Planctomycetota bacterium]